MNVGLVRNWSSLLTISLQSTQPRTFPLLSRISTSDLTSSLLPATSAALMSLGCTSETIFYGQNDLDGNSQCTRTVCFVNCFLKVLLLYQPCCLLPCMLPRQAGELSEEKLCTVFMYEVFCHLVSGTEDGAGRTLIEDDQREIHK